MKTTSPLFMAAIGLLFSLVILPSCDEGATVDVPGPDIEFHFSIPALRSAGTSFVRLAQSDTLRGVDIESFLTAKGQDYASIVEAAALKNAYLTLSEGQTFAGIDSLEIRYQLAGSDEELLLAQAGNTAASADTMRLSDICITKEQVYNLIKTDVVAFLYAKFDPLNPNLFLLNNTTCTFKAQTVLSVKLTSLLNNL